MTRSTCRVARRVEVRARQAGNPSTTWRDVGVGRGAVERHARRAWSPRSATASKERTLLAHLIALAQLQPPREHRARTWTDLLPVLGEEESPDLQARTRVQSGSMPLACTALTGGEGRGKRHCEGCQGKENSCAHGCCRRVHPPPISILYLISPVTQLLRYGLGN